MLDRRKPVVTTSAIENLPGVKIRSTARGRVVLMTNGLGETCTPTVFIDGARFDPRGEHDGYVDVDQLTDPYRIAGIEVYSRATQAPLQFGANSPQGCGVIVIWNRTVEAEKR
jgi:hypothetical protein